MKKIKVDCHTHTNVSFDSSTSPEKFVKAICDANMDAVCVCDHNTLAGARAVQALDPPFQVVIGEEIGTNAGELIGLFVLESIPSKRSPQWTIDAIHEQGALVMVPHPFCRVVPSHIRKKALYAIAEKVDIVEVVNARNNLPADERKAMAFARKHNLPACAGSDGHEPASLGMGYVLMDPFNDPQSFLANLAEGQLVCQGRTSLIYTGFSFGYHVLTAGIKSLLGR